MGGRPGDQQSGNLDSQQSSAGEAKGVAHHALDLLKERGHGGLRGLLGKVANGVDTAIHIYQDIHGSGPSGTSRSYLHVPTGLYPEKPHRPVQSQPELPPPGVVVMPELPPVAPPIGQIAQPGQQQPYQGQIGQIAQPGQQQPYQGQIGQIAQPGQHQASPGEIVARTAAMDEAHNLNNAINNDKNPFVNKNEHWELTPDGKQVVKVPGHIEYKPDGSAVVTDLNNKDRVTEVIAPDNTRNTFEYNQDGSISRFTSHAGDVWQSTGDDGYHWQCVKGAFKGERSEGPMVANPKDGTLAILNVGPPPELMQSRPDGNHWKDEPLDPQTASKLFIQDYFDRHYGHLRGTDVTLFGLTDQRASDALSNPQTSQVDKFVLNSFIKPFFDKCKANGVDTTKMNVQYGQIDQLVQYMFS